MIPIAEPSLGEKELEYLTDCLKSGWISSLGGYIVRFEEKFSRYCGARYGLATSSGTTALHLALATLGIGPGDEVLIPTLTFIATANAVVYCGAKPVFVDSEPSTWNMDPSRIEEKITPRTRAIIPVHVYGHPCDMDPILEIARMHGLFVIEDAAEAHGAQYKGRKVGSLGDFGCFSFYGNKIITTGEGGMVLTNDEKLAKKASLLRDHAMSEEKRYWHLEIGFNYRMTNLQAAIGLAQMEKIESFIEKKRQNAALYNQLLSGVRGLSLPCEAEWARSVYWMYSVLIEDDFGLSRDEVMARLREKGIDTRPFFYPLHTQPPYYVNEKKESYPVAEEMARKGINLPSAVTLNREEIAYIAETITSLAR